ncbi:hypothetical protein [Stenotrophomonas oahuensis]|uniref:Uncharacterized protein n=1 Tax=Stenotrophomonas oahuensis TaxID=3003271 RepID=A0ABY9YVD2_9GAMM|nr:hypothetical protein [Stenotrophomonas sp. A5586]WNH54510.1 hypothetical protein PDM29_09610 [Stenotrophomonas sp. A5586]
MSRKSKLRIRYLVALIGSLALIAIAGTISIDAGKLPYSEVNAAKNIGVFEDDVLRIAALTGLTGMYRTVHGSTSAPLGTVVDVTYADGTKEKGLVSCLGTMCTVPIEGTQQAAPGGSASGGDGSGGSGAAGGGGGIDTPGSGWGNPSPPICLNGPCEGSGTVTVG